MRAEFRVTEAINRVVIDHATGLHKGVADGRTDKSEAALLQVFAHRFRFGGLGRDVAQAAP